MSNETLIFSKNIPPHLRGLEIASWKITNFTLLNTNYDLTPISSTISQEIRQKYTIENIKEADIIAKYRKFYWQALKVDPTKTRPASEALIRRILKNQSLPKISAFVDAYNWASVKSLISLGAYDLKRISLPVQIRESGENETFVPIGKKKTSIPPNVLVTCDNTNQIMCQYPYRDAQYSLVSPQTTNILLLAYGIPGIVKKQLMEGLEATRNILNWMQDQKMINYSAESFEFHQN